MGSVNSSPADETKPQRFRSGTSIAAIILLCLLLNPLSLAILWMIVERIRIGMMETEMRDPKLYEPIGRTLAMDCQSDLSSFPENPGTAWLPPEVRKLKEAWGSFKPDGALVEFGGGFHHFGYRVELDPDNSKPGTNVWQLSLNSEASAEHLYTISLPAEAKFSREQLLAKVIAGYDAQIQKVHSDERAYRGKIQAYLRFDRVSEARAACQEMFKAMPDNWWAALINALVLSEAQANPDGGSALMEHWAARKETFSHYLDLAYFYQATGKRREAAQAIIQATHFSAGGIWAGDGGNTEYTGYTAAMRAYRAGEYDASAELCAHLLQVRINGDYNKEALRTLQNASEKALRGEVTNVTWENNEFDAFEELDLEKLLGRKAAKPAKRNEPLISTPHGD